MSKKIETLGITIVPHFYKPHTAFVSKITKNWIMVINNPISISRYNRETGYSSGAFSDRASLTPNQIHETSLKKIEEFMNKLGKETWDGGWKKLKDDTLLREMTQEDKFKYKKGNFTYDLRSKE